MALLFHYCSLRLLKMEKNKSTNFIQIFWFFLIFLLPFTSLPVASKLLGSTMVAAPSIIFLLPLLVIQLIKLLRTKFLLNPIIKPLGLFLIIAIISTLFAFWKPIPIQKDFSVFSNVVEGAATLLIGISFYFITSYFLNTSKIVENSIKFISYSFIPLIIWCFFQFYFGQIIHGYPDWMVSVQKIISTSGILYQERLTGFAFEPSWLAHQLNMFYIPIFLGASIKRYSAFKRRILNFIIEDFFLFCSIFILIFSKSRVGWITFFVILTYLFFRFNQQKLKLFQSKFSTGRPIIFNKILPIFLLLLYLSIIIFGLFIFSKFDPRMETLFQLETYKNRNIFSIANEFVFAERILYWQTGWLVFNDYPILGVGLNNIGFFFKDYMPSFAWALDEPRHLMFHATYQGNVKNLWIRLLSETGIVGFLCFVTWLTLLFQKVHQYGKSLSSPHQYWGLVGKIAILSLIFEGFSIDSFALPYYWIILGFISSQYLENMKLESRDIID